MDANELNPLTLAFYGDAVYEIYVRRRLVESGIGKPDRLHTAATKLVRASFQASAARRIEPMLSEKEADVLRRGRNAHAVKAPKNADVIDYRYATGLEALVGYLALKDERERLDLIMGEILDSKESEEHETEAEV